MKRLGITTVFLLLVCRAFCQYPVIPYEHIFNQPGLNDHFITCILQDNKGFIWFGGQNGIYRFDGYKNTYIKDAPGCSDCPPHFSVCDMVQDDRGMLWIITYDGIFLFSPETGRFRMIRRFNNTWTENDYGKWLDLCKDELGNIWASNDLGLLRFSYKKDNHVKPGPGKYEKYTLETDRFHVSRDTNSGQNRVQKIL